VLIENLSCRNADLCILYDYRPFALFGILPIGGRSTAIQLQNGGVWVLASTPLDAEMKLKIDELGPVK
jgi:hypothetical protein